MDCIVRARGWLVRSSIGSYCTFHPADRIRFSRNCRAHSEAREFAKTLSEKDRRRFAAIEALQRGYGGITYIARVLGRAAKTIERGSSEYGQLSDDPASGRVRTMLRPSLTPPFS